MILQSIWRQVRGKKPSLDGQSNGYPSQMLVQYHRFMPAAMRFDKPIGQGRSCGACHFCCAPANAFEPVQDGRMYIEKINGPFLFELKGTLAEYKAGLDHAIAKGWLEMHESGTYVNRGGRGDFRLRPRP